MKLESHGMGTEVRAVVFDVGETLIDESRVWGRWAEWMGVSQLTFFSVLGATIARGQSQRHAFSLIKPEFRPWEEIERRRQAGEDDREPNESDLYPDVVDCLTALKAAGFVIGVAGNQFKESETWLSRVSPAFDMIGSSEGWGVHKPNADFFERVAKELNLGVAEIAYVGDRLDNDVTPAHEAGMCAVFLRRGPWGHILGDGDNGPGLSVGSLGELTPALVAHNASQRA